MWKLSEHRAAPLLPGALKLHEMKNDFHFVGQFSGAEYTSHLTINECLKKAFTRIGCNCNSDLSPSRCTLIPNRGFLKWSLPFPFNLFQQEIPQIKKGNFSQNHKIMVLNSFPSVSHTVTSQHVCFTSLPEKKKKADPSVLLTENWYADCQQL